MYNEVLNLETLPTDDTIPQPDSECFETPPAKIFEEAKNVNQEVIGKQPNDYPEFARFGSRCAEIYGLQNQEQLIKLMEYLYLNGKYDLVPVNDKGSCMFAALRRGIDVPYEYTNTHMRETSSYANFKAY